MKKIKRLLDEYRFPGFRPKAVIKGKFGDHTARVIYFKRLLKKLFAVVVEISLRLFMIIKLELSVTCPVVALGFIYSLSTEELTAAFV